MNQSADAATAHSRGSVPPTDRLVVLPSPHAPGPEAMRALADDVVDAAGELSAPPASPQAAALVAALVDSPVSAEHAAAAGDPAMERFVAAVITAAAAVYWCRTVLHPVGECAFGPRAAGRCGLVLDAAHELAHR